MRTFEDCPDVAAHAEREAERAEQFRDVAGGMVRGAAVEEETHAHDSTRAPSPFHIDGRRAS
jgi:hypothetical protein